MKLCRIATVFLSVVIAGTSLPLSAQNARGSRAHEKTSEEDDYLKLLREKSGDHGYVPRRVTRQEIFEEAERLKQKRDEARQSISEDYAASRDQNSRRVGDRWRDMVRDGISYRDMGILKKQMETARRDRNGDLNQYLESLYSSLLIRHDLSNKDEFDNRDRNEDGILTGAELWFGSSKSAVIEPTVAPPGSQGGTRQSDAPQQETSDPGSGGAITFFVHDNTDNTPDIIQRKTDERNAMIEEAEKQFEDDIQDPPVGETSDPWRLRIRDGITIKELIELKKEARRNDASPYIIHANRIFNSGLNLYDPLSFRGYDKDGNGIYNSAEMKNILVTANGWRKLQMRFAAESRAAAEESKKESQTKTKPTPVPDPSPVSTSVPVQTQPDSSEPVTFSNKDLF